MGGTPDSIKETLITSLDEVHWVFPRNGETSLRELALLAERMLFALQEHLFASVTCLDEKKNTSQF